MGLNAWCYCLLAWGFCFADAVAQGLCPVMDDSGGALETWLEDQIQERRLERGRGLRTDEDLYILPVVVHVYHFGESIGFGSNLSADRIRNQIQILNQSFHNENPDGDKIHPLFLDLAVDANISFVLARQDPYGLPTDGIIRKEIPIYTRWGVEDKEEISSISYWPSMHYLNLWVVPSRVLGKDLRGFAQFPPYILQGIDPRHAWRYRFDGIVVKDVDIGDARSGARMDSDGHTVTHEIGHYLGLRHTWGDGGCEEDDYCTDTPSADGPNTNCIRRALCGRPEMMENYMNYTPDRCMGMFTPCQKERMRTVLEKSSIRSPLVSSPGLEKKKLRTQDLGIRRLSSRVVCTGDRKLTLEIANYGEDIWEHPFWVLLRLEGREVRKSFDQSLDSSEILEVHFLLSSALASGSHRLDFEIGSSFRDSFQENNELAEEILIFADESLPYQEDWESETVGSWDAHPDNLPGTTVFKTASSPANTMLAFQVSSTDYLSHQTSFLSPVFSYDRQGVEDIVFKFRYSYVHSSPWGDYDALSVVVFPDCRDDFSLRNILFFASAKSLGTSLVHLGDKLPTMSGAWRELSLPLQNLAKYSRFQIGIIRTHGAGSLYVDDLVLQTQKVHEYDVGLGTDVFLRSTCQASLLTKLRLRNHGSRSVLLENYSLKSVLNGEEQTYESQEKRFLEPLHTQIHELSLNSFLSGKNVFQAFLEIPSIDDANRVNDRIQHIFYFNTRRDFFPSKESFEDLDEKEVYRWYLVENNSSAGWQKISDPSQPENHIIKANFYANSSVGEEYWLLSPVYDLTDLEEASMSFRLSYEGRGDRQDILQVLISTNCGEDYEEVLYQRSGSDLQIRPSFRESQPSSDKDWRREYIDLSPWVGKPRIQLAMVGINRGGNHLYIDDIEFFTTQHLPAFREEGIENFVYVFPNPFQEYLYFHFQLDKKRDIHVWLHDLSGRLIWEQTYLRVLNQEYKVFLSLPPGRLYLLTFMNDENVLQRVKILSDQIP
ncbi:MAG: choice-of-anchor J domain-containing protein [Cytophagales bacterium]|nr:choice-of-anchor J domain-containing protein [Cytophagales bacterium]